MLAEGPLEEQWKARRRNNQDFVTDKQWWGTSLLWVTWERIILFWISEGVAGGRGWEECGIVEGNKGIMEECDTIGC